MSPSESNETNYRPEDIEVLRHSEHIRRRPNLYIGGTNTKGLHHLVFELLANCIDEARVGYGNDISVELLADRGCRVRDNGRGIPVHVSNSTGKSVLEILCTEPFASTKKSVMGPYTAGGLSGMGLKAVNALSVRMCVEVQQDSNRWLQEYRHGEPVADVSSVGRTEGTGTTVTFWPDPDIFPLGPNCRFSQEILTARLRELAFFNRSVTFRLIDSTDSTPRKEQFHFPDGLLDYVRCLNRDEEVVHPHIFHFLESEMTQQVEIALQWTRSSAEQIRTYCNWLVTVQGGTHQTGFRRGLTGELTQLLREHDRRPSHRLRNFGARCRRGLTAVVSITLQEPMFDGSTKDRLVNPDLEWTVQRCFARHFRAFLRRHPTDATAIVGKLQSNLSVP